MDALTPPTTRSSLPSLSPSPSPHPLLVLSPPNLSSFICTFCYRTCSYPAQALGRSARLCCPACYGAILNLSIYWVCGEMVFRGDECVSFGWCFWHKACYGCLLCGSRLVYRGPTVRELFEKGTAGVPGRGGSGRGREVSEAPLCAVCVVEAEIDGVSEEAVLRRGLRRVDKMDGGVTRKRWEVGTSDERTIQCKHDGGAALYKARKPRSKLGGDGTGYEGTPMDNQESTIWVNIFDPINGPSFRPSPLKPIPWWMHNPANISSRPSQHRNLGSRRSSFGNLMPPPRGSSRSVASAACYSRPSTPVPSRDGASSTPGNDAKPALRIKDPDRAMMSESPTPVPLKFKRVSTLVREEPLRHPSSRLSLRRHDTSDAEASAYMTPPEYADEDGLTGPEPLQLVAEIHRLIREKPGESSEYIHSYRTPKRAPAEPDGSRTPQPGITARRITESAVVMTRGGLDASETVTPTQAGALSARTSVDMVHRMPGGYERGEPRNVMKGVGAELRKLFARK